MCSLFKQNAEITETKEMHKWFKFFLKRKTHFIRCKCMFLCLFCFCLKVSCFVRRKMLFTPFNCSMLCLTSQYMRRCTNVSFLLKKSFFLSFIRYLLSLSLSAFFFFCILHNHIATNKAKTNRNTRIIQSFLSTSCSLSFPEWCLAL